MIAMNHIALCYPARVLLILNRRDEKMSDHKVSFPPSPR
jgi:hypothetical protein